MENKTLEEIKELVLDGLCIDGGHHKQWYLEQIAKKLEIDLEKEFTDEDGCYCIEEGIAP